MNSEDDSEDYKHVTRAKHLSIRRLFEGLPSAFEDKYRAMYELRQAFQDELADAIAPAIRQQVSIQPRSTIDERRELAAALFERVDSLGLGLACDHSKQVVHLTVDDEKEIRKLSGPSTGRFVLVHTDAFGVRTATQVSDQLPEINVVDKSELWEKPFTKWLVNTPPKGKAR